MIGSRPQFEVLDPELDPDEPEDAELDEPEPDEPDPDDDDPDDDDPDDDDPDDDDPDDDDPDDESLDVEPEDESDESPDLEEPEPEAVSVEEPLESSDVEPPLDVPLLLEPRLSVLKNPLPLNVTPTGWNTFLTGRISPEEGWAASVRVSSENDCWTSIVSPVSTNL